MGRLAHAVRLRSLNPLGLTLLAACAAPARSSQGSHEITPSRRLSSERRATRMFVVYTVWDHSLLRGPEQLWRIPGLWETNGFRTLTPDPADFFIDAESCRWQENLYRYIIAPAT